MEVISDHNLGITPQRNSDDPIARKEKRLEKIYIFFIFFLFQLNKCSTFSFIFQQSNVFSISFLITMPAINKHMDYIYMSLKGYLISDSVIIYSYGNVYKDFQ
jgi:hypothetical protein